MFSPTPQVNKPSNRRPAATAPQQILLKISKPSKPFLSSWQRRLICYMRDYIIERSLDSRSMKWAEFKFRATNYLICWKNNYTSKGQFILPRSTEHGVRSTEHGARGTEHGARSTEHGPFQFILPRRDHAIAWSNILFTMGKLEFPQLSFFVRAACSVLRAPCRFVRAPCSVLRTPCCVHVWMEQWGFTHSTFRPCSVLRTAWKYELALMFIFKKNFQKFTKQFLEFSKQLKNTEGVRKVMRFRYFQLKATGTNNIALLPPRSN